MKKNHCPLKYFKRCFVYLHTHIWKHHQNHETGEAHQNTIHKQKTGETLPPEAGRTVETPSKTGKRTK